LSLDSRFESGGAGFVRADGPGVREQIEIHPDGVKPLVEVRVAVVIRHVSSIIQRIGLWLVFAAAGSMVAIPWSGQRCPTSRTRSRFVSPSPGSAAFSPGMDVGFTVKLVQEIALPLRRWIARPGISSSPPAARS
jgi:hypothetical protein